MNGDLPKLVTAEPEDLVGGNNSVPQDGDAVISKDQSAATAATPRSTSSRPPPLGRVMEQDHREQSRDPTPPVTETDYPSPATESEEGYRAALLQGGRDIEHQAQLTQLKSEKDETKRKLDEKKKELKELREKTDREMNTLRDQISDSNKGKLADQEREIEKMREREDKCQKERDELAKEKHKLELKIEKMKTKTAKEKYQMSEAKLSVIKEQQTQIAREAEDKCRNTEEKIEEQKRIAREAEDKCRNLEGRIEVLTQRAKEAEEKMERRIDELSKINEQLTQRAKEAEDKCRKLEEANAAFTIGRYVDLKTIMLVGICIIAVIIYYYMYV